MAAIVDSISSAWQTIYEKTKGALQVAHGYAGRTEGFVKYAKVAKAVDPFLSAIQRSTPGTANLSLCGSATDEIVKIYDGIVNVITISRLAEKDAVSRCYQIGKIFDGALVLFKYQVLPRTQSLWVYAGRIKCLSSISERLQANKYGRIFANAVVLLTSLEMLKNGVYLASAYYEVRKVRAQNATDAPANNTQKYMKEASKVVAVSTGICLGLGLVNTQARKIAAFGTLLATSVFNLGVALKDEAKTSAPAA